MIYCECGCGRAIPEHEGRGRPRRFYEPACRKRASRAAACPVPDDMAKVRRWVRWQRIVRGDGTTKNPRTVDGLQASSTDPDTWASLEAARASTVGDGMGFVLGDGFACIDLDHCYDARRHLTDWAKMLIAPVKDRTYIEISPSGDGLHIWGRAPERTGVKVRGIMNAEAYSRARYITYTGRVWRKSPTRLADLTFLFDVITRLS